MNRQMKYLLDVNTLVALFDEAHIHHMEAHSWFESKGSHGWVTCPITENGLLMILSHPAYPNSPLPMVDLAERLEEFKIISGKYYFWNDDYSMSEWLSIAKLPIGSAHSTDAYLLKLCKKKEGLLATFDRRIKPSLIGEKSDECLEYIPT
jgi:predicted nucleic acid-binding protein